MYYNASRETAIMNCTDGTIQRGLRRESAEPVTLALARLALTGCGWHRHLLPEGLPLASAEKTAAPPHGTGGSFARTAQRPKEQTRHKH
eukprot:COSAG01_NODE_1581_length_9827_cov_12.794613_6_plen_89_part_00